MKTLSNYLTRVKEKCFLLFRTFLFSISLVLLKLKRKMQRRSKSRPCKFSRQREIFLGWNINWLCAEFVSSSKNAIFLEQKSRILDTELWKYIFSIKNIHLAKNFFLEDKSVPSYATLYLCGSFYQGENLQLTKYSLLNRSLRAQQQFSHTYPEHSGLKFLSALNKPFVCVMRSQPKF